MAITITDAHRKLMIEQAQNGVLNMQMSVANNAATHKQWALDESVPLAELQQRITDTIAAYESIRSRLRHFRDVTIPADSGFLSVGDSLKLTLQSVGNVGQEVADHIDAFAAMPRSTYAEIIAACDYLITNVNSPPSVWD
jgi:hypothetical protein